MYLPALIGPNNDIPKYKENDMLLSAKNFIEELESRSLKYTVRETGDTEVVVSFPYNGKTTNYFFSGEDGKYVSMYTLFENVPKDRLSQLCAVCNKLNADYKWFEAKDE